MKIQTQVDPLAVANINERFTLCVYARVRACVSLVGVNDTKIKKPQTPLRLL